MGLFDFFRTKPVVQNLAENVISAKSSDIGDLVSTGKRATAETESALTRVNPINLEKLYHQDEIVFNGVNVISSMFLSSDYDIKASNESEKAKTNAFLRSIDFNYLIQRIVQDMCIYGNSWVELVYNTKGDLVNVACLDPKVFDVVRNAVGLPVYDEYGLPLGYVQYLSSNVEPPSGSKVISQSDLWGNNYKAIEIPMDKLAHFVMYTVGNDPLGIGIVEPMYNVTMSKNTVRNGITQSTQRMGWPLIGFKVGDEQHHPTPDQLRDLYSKVSDINERTTFVHAYFIEPYVLESKQSSQMHEHLTHYENAQIATLGIPKSLVTGAGEETNRSTLERQIYIWEKRAKFIQHRIVNVVEKQIMTRLAKQWSFQSVPKIVFEDISTESIFGRVERWSNLAKVGLIQPDTNIRQYIRDLEHLPPEADDVKPAQSIGNPKGISPGGEDVSSG